MESLRAQREQTKKNWKVCRIWSGKARKSAGTWSPWWQFKREELERVEQEFRTARNVLQIWRGALAKSHGVLSWKNPYPKGGETENAARKRERLARRKELKPKSNCSR
jgi:hypothetical protein